MKKASSGGSGRGALVVLLGIFGFAGLMVWLSRSEAAGSLTLRGDAGAGTFVADDCKSGVHEGFFGVEVAAKDGARLRVVRDADGRTKLLRSRPGAAVFDAVPRESCRRFEVDVREEGASVNDVSGMALDLAVDCGDLEGQLKARDCH